MRQQVSTNHQYEWTNLTCMYLVALSELVSCGADKSVVIWDVSDGRVKRRLRQHAATVNCVKYNEESSVVVSGSNDNTVCCWDTRSRSNNPIQV